MLGLLIKQLRQHNAPVVYVSMHFLFTAPAVHHKVVIAICIAFVQVNARKIYDEANVFSGVAANKLFTAILLGEATLQVWSDLCGQLVLVA